MHLETRSSKQPVRYVQALEAVMCVEVITRPFQVPFYGSRSSLNLRTRTKHMLLKNNTLDSRLSRTLTLYRATRRPGSNAKWSMEIPAARRSLRDRIC